MCQLYECFGSTGLRFHSGISTSQRTSSQSRRGVPAACWAPWAATPCNTVSSSVATAVARREGVAVATTAHHPNPYLSDTIAAHIHIHRSLWCESQVSWTSHCVCIRKAKWYYSDKIYIATGMKWQRIQLTIREIPIVFVIWKLISVNIGHTLRVCLKVSSIRRWFRSSLWLRR